MERRFCGLSFGEFVTLPPSSSAELVANTHGHYALLVDLDGSRLLKKTLVGETLTHQLHLGEHHPLHQLVELKRKENEQQEQHKQQKCNRRYKRK
ncbi:hypothetical protein E2542_SST03870 [Spatholobus suberectus]|nr:hypothetical protein E2542_SST03870 [Spatholobus suberectus]